MAVTGSLIAHLIWGIALGTVYGNVAERRVNIGSAIVTLVPFLVISTIAFAQRPGSPIVIAQDMTDVATYDPGRVFERPALPVVHNVYDTLVAYKDGQYTRLAPDLAESWTISQDGLVYTFELRHGVMCFPGNMLTANDVAWSYRRLKNLKDHPSHLADPIVDIRAVGLYTVRIRLAHPFSGFLSSLTSPQFGVLDGKTVLAHGGMAGPEAATSDKVTPWLNTHSAGTGPWILESYKPHQQTVLARNPNYWGGDVYHGRVIFKHEKEAASRFLDLERGRADIALDLTIPQIAEARKSQRIRVLELNSLTPAEPQLLIPVRDTVGGIGIAPITILELRSASKK